MNKDIFQEAKTKKVETTMYEVNDSGREAEYSGHAYLPSFVSFIQSLGFNSVESPTHVTSDIIINGVRFHVNLDSASYMSKNSYTRERYVRKPQNRFITLTDGNYDNNYIVKIFFNKEMDAAKIKSKIEKNIAAHYEKVQQALDKENERETNTTLIGNHYCKNEIIKASVRSICIEKGLIKFSLKHTCQINVNASDNAVHTASFYQKEMTSFLEIADFEKTVLERAKNLATVAMEIEGMPKISDELIQWSATQYNQYFYTETMSTKYEISK